MYAKVMLLWCVIRELAVVDTVTPSNDGRVRTAVLRYELVQKIPAGGDRVSTVHITRSVQRLVMILPVEEQQHSVVVKDDEVAVTCVKEILSEDS